MDVNMYAKQMTIINTDKVSANVVEKPDLFLCLCKGFVILLIQCCSKCINLKV